jgi:hypothetical protein
VMTQFKMILEPYLTQVVSPKVHSMQSSTSPNGNQQPDGNKKKGHNNNRKGGKNN